jgi:hypothetical protein
MAFSDFIYPEVIRDLGLTETSAPDVFADVPPVPPSAPTAALLPMAIRLGTTAHTEAARSTWMVGNVLLDLWGRYAGQLNLSAGVTFNADPDAKLTGLCDFLIGRGPQLPHVVAPVCVIFEAKKDSVPDGFGQCVAGMVGVQRFNRREGRETDPVYGCSTTGALWRFLTLSGTNLTVDQSEYAINQIDRILGILAHIAGPVPARSAA